MTRLGPVAGLSLVLAALLPAPTLAGPVEGQPVTLTLWDYPRWPATPDSVDRFHWVRARIAEFERARPGVRVDLTRLSWDYGADKVRVAALAGVGPDLVAGAPMTEFITRGLVEPVDDFLSEADRADYLPTALQAFTWDGRVWGWPWYETGSVLLLNRTRFAAAGVPLPDGGRWTPEEFERALSALSAPEATPARYGLGFAIKGGLGIWPWLFGAEGPVSAAGRVAFDASAVAGGMGSLERYISRGWAPTGSGGMPPGPVWEAFALRQSTAVAPFGVWAIPALRERAGFPFAVAAYPSAPDARTPTFVAVSGWMVFRHGDAARRAAAMALARFLTSGERQRDLQAYGVFPTRRSAGNLYEDDAQMARAAAILAEGRPIPLHPHWPQIEDVVGAAVQAALTGQGEVATILDGTAQRLRSLEAETAAPSFGTRPRRARGGRLGVAGGIAVAVATVLLAGRGTRWRYALFAAPAVAAIGGFMLWPLVWSFALSFGTFDVARGWFGEWVGLRHYASLFGDPVFRAAVRNTALYTGVVVPLQVGTALLLASLIAPFGRRMRAWFRGAFYLPGVVSVVVLSIVWRWIFREEAGALNGLLGFWGIGPVGWLSDPDVALWSIILTAVARPPGGPMLIYLAALDAIPAPLYDAASLDGSTAWRRWWHVTVPLVAPTTGFLLVTGTIGAFQVFAQVFVLTDGGPGTATTVLVHQIYTTAMRDFAFGRASAIAVVLAVVLALAAYAQTRRRRPVVEF